jgi:hypothetical protein
MASPTGGRFIIGAPSGFNAVAVGINDGTDPITQSPVTGSFNIEVFTAAGATLPATFASGFQAGILDPGGTIVPLGTGGALTGTNLTLGTGNYVITDTLIGGRAAASVTLGSGTQRIVGAGGDTLQGGSGPGILDAIQQFSSGAETIIGGSGPTTVYGGTYVDGTAGNMRIGVGTGGTELIVGTSSNNTISGAATAPDVITGGAAAVTIQSLGKGDIVNFAGQTGNATINANTALNAANVGGVSATLGGGLATIYGGAGDTINLGSVGQYADGGPGRMTITDGSAGVDSVFGSSVSGGGDTFVGGSAALQFNPEAGGGDLLNLSGSSGNATINVFNPGPTGANDIANINDTIMVGTGTDSVWGGQGDRIGVGTSSTAGGTHLFDHSTSIAGAAIAFGTNDSVANSSSANVTVTHFNTGTDSLFYQGETANTTNNIVATSSTSGGNTTFTLPDGTVMTLIGVSSINSGLFKP